MKEGVGMPGRVKENVVLARWMVQIHQERQHFGQECWEALTREDVDMLDKGRMIARWVSANEC